MPDDESQEQRQSIKIPRLNLPIIPKRTDLIIIEDAVPTKSTLHPRHRMHIVVAGSVIVMALMTLAGVLPGTRSFGPLEDLPWNASAQGFANPTATPFPLGTFPTHPVVQGVHAFLCVALPLARLAQQEMLAKNSSGSALRYPWYVSVILAQWAIEQGWGMPTYTGYNFGNVSAIAGYPRVSGGGVPGAPGWFAYADTPTLGVFFYVIFTKLSLYREVDAVYASGPIAQAYALGQSPWDAAHYTPDGQPGDSLVNVMLDQNLQRFDQPNATC